MFESFLGRLRAVHTKGMFGGVATVGPHQTKLVWRIAEVVHHRGNCMHDVVVPRATGKRQATSAGELRIDIEAK